MNKNVKKVSFILLILAVYAFFGYRNIKRQNEGGLTNLDGDIKLINKTFDKFSWSNYVFNEDGFSVDATKEIKKTNTNELQIPDSSIIARQNIYVSDTTTSGPMFIIQAINYNQNFDFDKEVFTQSIEGGFTGRVSEIPQAEIVSKSLTYTNTSVSLDYKLKSKIDNKNVNILGKMIFGIDGILNDLEVMCYETECNPEDYIRFMNSFKKI